MKINLHRMRRGFTLIELSVSLGIGVMTSAMVVALFNQQLEFLKIYKTQTFLTNEAPIISMYLSRLIGKADRFRLHASLADALAGINPRLTASPVAVLNFSQPDGTTRATILSFEDRGSGLALYYYVVPTNGMLGTPQWFVTKAASDVSFSVQQGVLRVALTGRGGELVTYSGTMQQ
jgi:prepilin-type N-terminal cleavage/methylation domain-containing protein